MLMTVAVARPCNLPHAGKINLTMFWRAVVMKWIQTGYGTIFFSSSLRFYRWRHHPIPRHSCRLRYHVSVFLSVLHCGFVFIRVTAELRETTQTTSACEDGAAVRHVHAGNCLTTRILLYLHSCNHRQVCFACLLFDVEFHSKRLATLLIAQVCK